MNRILLCSLIAGAAWASDRPAPAPEAVEPLVREIAVLRAELYRLGAEFLEWKVWQIAAEYEKAAAEQRRLEREERALVDELTTADGSDGEAGARRGDLSSGELPRLRESNALQGQKTAELSALLAKERQRLATLQQLAEQAAVRVREIEGEEQKERGK